MIANGLRQSYARLRNPVAFDQAFSDPIIDRKRRSHCIALQQRKSQRRIADRARHHDAVARFGAGAPDHPSGQYPAEGGNRNHQRPRGRDGISAEQRAFKPRRILAKRARERRKPCIIGRTQSQRQHKAGRHRALGREI